MAITPINNSSLLAQMTSKSASGKVSNVEDIKPQELQNDIKPSKNKHNSSVPYVAGAIALAALAGVYMYLNKGKSTAKTKEVVEDIVEKVKNNSDKEKKEIVQGLQDGVSIIMPNKKPITKERMQLKEMIKDAEDVVFEEIPFNLPPLQNRPKPIVVDSKSVIVNKPPIKNLPAVQRKVAIVGTSGVDSSLLKTILEKDEKYISEVYSIVSANTFGGYVNIPVLEKVAKDFSLDVNRPDRFLQSAQLLEQSYKSAYVSIKPSKVCSGHEKFLNRIVNESSDLFSVYSQLPKEQSQARIENLVNKLYPEGYKVEGLSKDAFKKSLNDAYQKYLAKK